MPGQRSRRGWRSWIAAAIVGVITFAGLVVILSAFRTDRPEQVRPIMVASGEWAPFVGSDLPDGGPVARVMSEVFAGAGYDAQLSFSSWASVDHRTSSGAVFGGFPLVVSADRADRMLVSEPLLAFDYVLFVRAGAENVPESAADLGALTVGGIAGYDYWAEFDEAAGEIERFESTEEGLRALHDGRIDVFAEGEASAFSALRDPDLSFDSSAVEIVESDEAWARSTQHLFFMMQRSNENERVMATINEGIVAARGSEEYRAMLEEIAPGQLPADTVVLSGVHGAGAGAGSGGAAVALRDEQGEIVAHTPRGVRARVLEWPASLTGGELGADAMVSVKLIDGPLQGRIFNVSLTDVEVSA